MEKTQFRPIIIVILILATIIAVFKIWKNIDYFYTKEDTVEIIAEDQEPLVDLSTFSVTAEPTTIHSEESFSLQTNIPENGTYYLSYPCEKNVSLTQDAVGQIACDTKTKISVDNHNIDNLTIKSDNAASLDVPITIFYTENKTNRHAKNTVILTIINDLIK